MKKIEGVGTDFGDLILGAGAFLCPEAETMTGLEDLTRQFAMHGMNAVQIGLDYSSGELRAFGRLCAKEGVMPSSIVCYVHEGPEASPKKAFEKFKEFDEKHRALQDGYGKECVMGGPILHALDVVLRRPKDVRPQDFVPTIEGRQIEFLGFVFDLINSDYRLAIEYLNMYEHNLAGPHDAPSMMELITQIDKNASSIGVLADTVHMFLRGEMSVEEAINEIRVNHFKMGHISPAGRTRVRGNKACMPESIKAMGYKALKADCPLIIEVAGRNTPPAFLDLLKVHEFSIGGNATDCIVDAFSFIQNCLRQEVATKS